MKHLILFINVILISHSFSQTIDQVYEKKILKKFELREYKECVDLGVEFLIKYGDDSLKYYIKESQNQLYHFDENKIEYLDRSIMNAVRLAPKLIPQYAIYSGLGEICFWMLYNDDLSQNNKEKVIKLSSTYFKRAIEKTPTDSLKVKARIYLAVAEICYQASLVYQHNELVKIAFGYDSDNSLLGKKVADLYEEEGKIDSSMIILKHLYYLDSNLKSLSLEEYIADNLSSKDNKKYYYSKALATGKNKAQVLIKLGDLDIWSDKETAIKYYEEAYKVEPNNTDVLLTLGFQYYLQGDYQKSLLYYKKISNWDSISSWNYSFHNENIGRIYYEMEDYKNALQYFLKTNNNSRIANSYYNLGEYKNAIKYYQLDIENTKNYEWLEKEDKDRNIAYSYYLKAICYVELDDRVNAFYSFQSANQYDSQDKDYKHYLETYRILKDNPEWEIINFSNIMAFLVDNKRIEKNGQVVKTWIKSVFYSDDKDINMLRAEYIKQHNVDANQYNNMTHSLNQIEFDCAKKKIRTLQTINYAENGVVIDSYKFENTDWADVIPESIGEQWLEYFCKK